MSTLFETCVGEDVARDGIAVLRAGGVPGRDIRLLAGRPLRDVRSERVGGFAGPVGPDARVGTFANGDRRRSQGTGTYVGDADRHRQGSFADADRGVVVTYDDDRTGHAHAMGHAALRRVLRDAALEPAAVDRALELLRSGRVIVLADIAEITPGDAREQFERATAAG